MAINVSGQYDLVRGTFVLQFECTDPGAARLETMLREARTVITAHGGGAVRMVPPLRIGAGGRWFAVLEDIGSAAGFSAALVHATAIAAVGA